MKFFIFSVLLISQTMFGQVDMSEQEKIEQQREKNRQEDALRDSALKPNESTSQPQNVPIHIDSDAQLDVDHSAFGYSLIAVNGNPISGLKISGGFTAGFYQEQKLEKRYMLMAGVELPIDIDLPTQKIVPFAGGGFQVGLDSGVYLELGLDMRLARWFKIQIGLHYVLGQDANGLIGAALTW